MAINRELFWRHRVMLKLLEMAPDRRANKLQFIKWLFLLKQEEELGGNPRFYDFLPFKFGPFSFLVYKDLEDLQAMGLVRIEGKSVSLNAEGNKTYRDISQNDIHSIQNVLERFGKISISSLVNYVYREYPWFASRSGRNRMGALGKAQTMLFERSVFSIGYEHLSIDAFLNALLTANISALIDSRSSAISRKFGYSKLTLQKRVEDLGIKYYDFGVLGIPFGMRNGALSKGDLWAKYRRTILSSQPDKLIEIAQIAKLTNAALLCFECDPHDCHRHILAKEVEKIAKLQIVNFNNQEKKWEIESRF